MKQRNLNAPRRTKTHRAWYRLRRPQNSVDTTGQDTVIHKLAHSQSRGGIIRPNTGDLHVPSDLVERGDGQQTNLPHGVLLVIITLALVFISVITYFVSQMPQKP